MYRLIYPGWVLTCQLSAFDVPRHSVSGVSSGGDMALNHFIAFSSNVEGVGIVAGAPYGCNVLENNATDRCGTGGWPSNLHHSARLDKKLTTYMRKRAKQGLIDPLASLRGRRVYLYSGQYDWVVNQSVMHAVSRQVIPLTGKSSMVHDFDTPSTHGWVVDGSHCGHGKPGSKDSWCEACCCSPDALLACTGHDLAGRILQHLRGRSFPTEKGKLDPSSIIPVPQKQYVPNGRTLRNTGLWHTGYVYAPKFCRSAFRTFCSVHVHYHGCAWGAEFTGKLQLQRLGLMEWAEAANVVLVFPQASSSIDEAGCWDWTGEVNPLFDTKEGPQLKFVMSFLADLPHILASIDDDSILV